MAQEKRGTVGSSNRSSRGESTAYGRGDDPQGQYGQGQEKPAGIAPQARRRRPAPAQTEGYGIGGISIGSGAAPAVAAAGAAFLIGLFLGQHTWQSQGQGSRTGRWTWTGRQGGSRLWQGGDSGSDVEADETFDLIASSKVEGTNVYSRDGEKLGHIQNFMVGKRSGRVAYAVLNFGGLMGVGGSYYPLPWNQLTYDTDKGGYVVDLDKERIGSAPNFRPFEDPFTDPGYGRRVSEYWAEAA